MLLRKRGVAQSVLAMALLVAILASTTSIVNHVDSYAQALGALVGLGRTYLVLSKGASSVADSRVDAELASKLRGLGYFDYVLAQRTAKVNVSSCSGNALVSVRGVEGVGDFLRARGAQLSGAIARERTEAVAGEVLANALSLGLGAELVLAAGERRVGVRVVGVFRSQTQSDSELVVPMEALSELLGDDAASVIELVLKAGADRSEALGRLARLLPEDVELVQVQQMGELARQVGSEALSFLSAWSLIVYAAIAVASHAIASRLVVESGYELAMLRALGAKRSDVLALVLAYTAMIALASSVLGIAVGTAGAQVVSKALRWIRPDIDMAPFLVVEQALQILLLALASSILGCACPALKATRARYVEQQL